MVKEESDIYTVNLDDLIEKITKTTTVYIDGIYSMPIIDKASRYMEIYFYIEGALTTYEMILKVGYLEVNEKTGVPIFDIIDNTIEEVKHNKISPEEGWEIILPLTKIKGELIKNTGIKFNISLYALKETITLNIIELYKDIESSITIDKAGKYILFTGLFKGAGSVYYSLLTSIGTNLQEQPIPILKFILDIDSLYWDGELSPGDAWDEIGETMRRLM